MAGHISAISEAAVAPPGPYEVGGPVNQPRFIVHNVGLPVRLTNTVNTTTITMPFGSQAADSIFKLDQITDTVIDRLELEFRLSAAAAVAAIAGDTVEAQQLWPLRVFKQIQYAVGQDTFYKWEPEDLLALRSSYASQTYENEKALLDGNLAQADRRSWFDGAPTAAVSDFYRVVLPLPYTTPNDVDHPYDNHLAWFVESERPPQITVSFNNASELMAVNQGSASTLAAFATPATMTLTDLKLVAYTKGVPEANRAAVHNIQWDEARSHYTWQNQRGTADLTLTGAGGSCTGTITGLDNMNGVRRTIITVAHVEAVATDGNVEKNPSTFLDENDLDTITLQDGQQGVARTYAVRDYLLGFIGSQYGSGGSRTFAYIEIPTVTGNRNLPSDNSADPTIARGEPIGIGDDLKITIQMTSASVLTGDLRVTVQRDYIEDMHLRLQTPASTTGLIASQSAL